MEYIRYLCVQLPGNVNTVRIAPFRILWALVLFAWLFNSLQLLFHTLSIPLCICIVNSGFSGQVLLNGIFLFVSTIFMFNNFYRFEQHSIIVPVAGLEHWCFTKSYKMVNGARMLYHYRHVSCLIFHVSNIYWDLHRNQVAHLTDIDLTITTGDSIIPSLLLSVTSLICIYVYYLICISVTSLSLFLLKKKAVLPRSTVSYFLVMTWEDFVFNCFYEMNYFLWAWNTIVISYFFNILLILSMVSLT